MSSFFHIMVWSNSVFACDWLHGQNKVPWILSRASHSDGPSITDTGAGYNYIVGHIWPAGRKFDTSALKGLNHALQFKGKRFVEQMLNTSLLLHIYTEDVDLLLTRHCTMSPLFSLVSFWFTLCQDRMNLVNMKRCTLQTCRQRLPHRA